MCSCRSFILLKERLESTVVLLSVIVLSSLFMNILPANGAIEGFNAYANRTLIGVDKNLTSASLTTAITQLNNSEHASDLEEAGLFKEVAKTNIRDLINALSLKSNHLNLDPLYEGSICTDNPNDCTIADLHLVLNIVDHSGEKESIQILQHLYNQTR
jgi:hypothetical protein